MGGYGKGKGNNAEGGKGGQGHTLERIRLSAEKFTGTVKSWRHKYGFIQPAEEIAHEKATLYGGALFCSVSDLIGVEGLELGAPVAFHVFEDESGLGAEEVVQTGAGNPALAGKGAGAKGGKGKSWAAGGAAAGGWGGGGKAGWGGAQAKGGWGASGYGAKGASKGWGATSAWTPYGAKGKGKGKGKDKNRGQGHTLERTRISADKFLGTVSAWKGKYGWITPVEEISHPKASAKKGVLFASLNDLIGSTELTEGATVEFHIFEDSSGLGAEEVVQHA